MKKENTKKASKEVKDSKSIKSTTINSEEKVKNKKNKKVKDSKNKEEKPKKTTKVKAEIDIKEVTSKASKKTERTTKYKYPKDILNDKPAMKKWRAEVRNKMRKFEKDLSRIDPSDKEYKKVTKEMEEYKQSVYAEL